ncbi:FecR family protein [Chryseolinea sp. H1M3-3]|uniref:FecR family protein n=1 Tax=Chryseolinea sp. H1M3-3 TaxID=3034144 RepID=UPI0023EC701D|nr:FecR family protein [Chryseolinea sp. H1M3-3]
MKNNFPDILKKYLARTCTPEERAMVDSWFKQFENDAEDPRLADIYERVSLDAKMLEEIKQKIHEHNAIAPLHSKGRSLTLNLYKAAVGIAAVLVIGVLVFYLKQPQAAETQITYTTISNSSEGITRHELVDGTLIWLRPNSRIEFPIEFVKDKRELTLAGEAFFDVARDAHRPFIITTGNVTTKVLGTSFNIKAYDESSSIEVSVLTGKVSVDIAGAKNNQAVETTSVLLVPNERVTYLKEKNQLEKEESKKLPELSMWQATDVVFDNVSVKEVIDILNKKFSVRIQASNKNLLNCLIRADFTNQNLPDILELLSKSVEATYEIKDNTIYLSGEGCEK